MSAPAPFSLWIRRRFKQSIAVLAVAAGLSAGLSVGLTTTAQAGPVLATTSGVILDILFIQLATTVGGAASSASTDITDQIDGKLVLANAAVEDAAAYYETGKLSGVLPAAVARIREKDAELAKLSDAELVDAVVEAAEEFSTQAEALRQARAGRR